MVNYLKLGYSSEEEYNIDFQETLLETNHTYDYFVNWNKVFKNITEYREEIEILNSLNRVNSSNIEHEFKNILNTNPQVIKIISALLGIREKNISVLDTEKKEFKRIILTKTPTDMDEIVDFCRKTGLLNLLTEIEDLRSYLIGVEAGLDSNGRKSRSGTIFEDIVGELLSEKIRNHPQYSLYKEDTIPFERTKRWDYVIYKNNEPKFFFECNFYNGSGSKPIETANAYVDLQYQVREKNLTFIWITDGKGWKKMSKAIREASKGIDYVLNYRMLSERIDKILFD